MSYPRLVRQPPQYGGFEDTQEELDWYGSNPEGIDRDRTPEAEYSDEFLPLKEEDSGSSDGEWSRPTYSDASRSPSPPSKPSTSPSSHKRKASTSLDERKEHPRKGSKRGKPAPVIPPELASTMLKLPPHTPETRQAAFSLGTPICWTAEESHGSPGRRRNPAESE
ncbi:hypothetical protein HO173_003231 [Letharia columbiana]|uniref:Uncharacterized protein n=1 Tax=Letharia columbiana TaxID=112416 RepID=A0A8H6L7T2_9LECA|nr:uncharacterized protein HO173_003231 [Letharia columbiana]KAF6238725.1 hypothetical protein HO173_003231 [Letharia columbiana]